MRRITNRNVYADTRIVTSDPICRDDSKNATSGGILPIHCPAEVKNAGAGIHAINAASPCNNKLNTCSGKFEMNEKRHNASYALNTMKIPTTAQHARRIADSGVAI
jgi:hypothetical protein